MEEKNMQNKVRFKIGEIEFEAEGSAEVIARERKEFFSTLLPLASNTTIRTASIKEVPQISISPQSSNNDDNTTFQSTEDLSRMSLSSFIIQKGAKSHPDFILCAAFFKEKKNGMQSFSKNSAESFFEEVKKPVPKNISVYITRLIQRGLIMEYPSAKGSTPTEYILTGAGEEYVNNFQPKQVKTRKTSSKPKKSQKKQTKKV